MTDRPTEPSGLRIRQAVRALVVDADNRVLLVRFEFPAGRRWALPGGGIEPGESATDALTRELAEEVGMIQPAIGAHIWDRTHIVPFLDGAFDGQHEQIHLVRTARFDPQPTLSWDQLNREYVFELKWWTVDEIAGSDDVFVPSHLAELVTAIIDDGPPPHPIDVSPHLAQ